MRLAFSIEIERSVEDIYELVGNPENDVKWQDAVVEVHKLTPGPIQAGSRYRHTLRIFGKRMGIDVEVIERQLHSGYVLQCRSAPFDFETRVQLRHRGRATLLDTIIEGRPTGAARVAAVVLSRHRSGEIERDLHKLKRLMESGKL